MISRFLNRAGREDHVSDLGHLTRLVRRYTVEQQQVPQDLLDLVELNYLAAIPVAPQGRKFVIDRKRVEVRLE